MLKQVDTTDLPHVICEDGVWYFDHPKTRIPLAGEQGDATFMGHYRTLCRMFNVGEEPADDRTVYFVGWAGGPIKIGLTENINSRLRILQCACPYDLAVLAVAAGGLKGELEYHERFKRHHLRGEWFERAPEIEAEIDRLNAALPAN